MDFASYQALGTAEKTAIFGSQNRLSHALLTAQFEPALVQELCLLAKKIRLLSETTENAKWLRGLLAHKRALLYFSQPSTRTWLSFTSALHILGIALIDIGSQTTLSSSKGETLKDLFQVISRNVHLLVIRSESETLAEEVAITAKNGLQVVNAGSGKKEHPTQALLDYLTITDGLGDNLTGKHFVFVGDLARGRAARSLIFLLMEVKDVSLTFVAPKALQVDKEILSILKNKKVHFEQTENFNDAIQKADVVYMTRMQDEWSNDGVKAKTFEAPPYCLGKRELQYLKPSCLVMHPLPRRDELSSEIDGDHRAWYWRQVENGVWMRAALIAKLFNVESQIMEAP